MNRKPLTIFIPHCSDLLTDHLPHGDGIVAHSFIERLAERGHTLHVVAERVDLLRPLPANVHITVLTPKSANRAVERLRYMVRLRAHFKALSRSTRIDVVHQLNPVFAGMSLAIVPTQLPVVLGTYVPRWANAGGRATDPDALSAGGGLRGWLAMAIRDAVCKWQQRYADLLLLVSPASYNRIPERAAVEAKIRWLAHGVDTDVFSPGAAAPGADTILFLASLTQRKGIFTLLEAMPAVIARVPTVRLTIAGDGADRAAARALAARLGLEEHVQFVGRVERSETPSYYRGHSVYCLPSFGEPYATSILEAMACGSAIVLADSGGLRYMVPEDGGIRFVTGDAAALADALVTLLEDRARCVAMGVANRQRVLEAFDWPGIIERLEVVYDEAMQIGEARRAGAGSAKGRGATR